MTLNNTYFLLFQNCIPVKGTNGSIIMDLDTSSYLDIPDLLFDVITQTKGLAIEEAKEYFKHEYDEGIEGYFNYLVEKKYGFFTNDMSNFISAPTHFNSPYKVISSVIAINDFKTFDVKYTIKQLAELSCQLLQIRIYEAVEFIDLIENLSPLIAAPFRIVELYLKYGNNISQQQLQNLCIKHPNLVLVVHSAPNKKQIEVSKDLQRKISYYKTEITKDQKELFTKGSLNISQPLYYEALNFNAGLNRKVSIDEYGNIKNYVSHQKDFGNVNSITIGEVIEKDEFKEKYLISNDKIEVCKDCKYRYMCINNSDIEKKQGKYYKLTNCGIND